MESHLKDFIWSNSLRFSFYRFLHILKRRIPLPEVLFTYDISSLTHEKVLAKYFVPKHKGCFIDVGANVGFWTVYLGRKRIIVHAFEPNPKTAMILKHRVRNSSNIHVHQFALGDENRIGKFKIHRFSRHDSLVFKRNDFLGKQISVRIRTLDSFQFENVGLIKIDTEGFEEPVLLGAMETIHRNKPRLIIEIHEPFKEQEEKICAILKSLKYHWVFIGSNHLIADVAR